MFGRPNSGAESGSAGEPPPGRGLIRELGRYTAKQTLAVIGAFGAITAFITFLGKESPRHWIQAHSYPVFAALVAAVLLLLGTGSYAYNLAARYRELDRATRAREIAKGESAYADALVQLLAFFGPDPVSRGLLQPGNVPAPTEELGRLLTDPGLLRQAAAELLRLSLAEVDPADGTMTLRRIAQETARGQLSTKDPGAARAISELVQSMLAASDPGTQTGTTPRRPTGSPGGT